MEENTEKIEVLSISECKNAPFQMAKLSTGKISVVCGKVRYETDFEDLKECEKWIDTKPYEMVGLLVESYHNYLCTTSKN